MSKDYFVKIIFSFVSVALLTLFVGAIFLMNDRDEIFNPTASSYINDFESVSLLVDEKLSNQEIKLLFVGDTMLARTIGNRIENGENPFKYVKDKFDQYDYVIANLECVVADEGDQINKLYTFRAPEESIQLLKDNGIDFVSLANNHVKDYGEKGMIDMIENLENVGIGYFGGGRNDNESFSSLDINHFGTTISFFGYNDRETYITNSGPNEAGTAYFDEGRIKVDISSLQSDIIIPFVHWGPEYALTEDSRQSRLGKLMIDSGATLVVGAHPHVIQPTREYKDKEIFYSLGNFVFDQMPKITRDANMLEVIIQDREIQSTNLIPVRIDEKGFPQIIDN